MITNTREFMKELRDSKTNPNTILTSNNKRADESALQYLSKRIKIRNERKRKTYRKKKD